MLQEGITESRSFSKQLANLRQEIAVLEKLNRFLEMKVQQITQSDDSPPLWVKIEDRNAIMTIIANYADKHKKTILDMLKEKPATILEMIKHVNLPQTTAYRKINELIDSNLIVRTGLFFNKNTTKRVNLYSTTIRQMRIYFEENKIMMFVVPEVGMEEIYQKTNRQDL